MNRKSKIEKLLSEGLSSQTLLNLTDKNIDSLYSRLVNEDEEKHVKVSSETPNIKTVVDKLKTQGVDNIEITEDEKDLDNKKKNPKFVKNKKQVKDKVNKLVENSYTNFTSKKDILEMITSKLEENEETEINEKKIPEFMTYDSIKADAPTKTPTKVPTKPTTSPGVKPRTPYNPGPGRNPKPKAMGEDKKVK